MAVRFDGKVALVTGAGGGLGRAYALLLGSLGAKVVINELGGGLKGDAGSCPASGGGRNRADLVVEEIRRAGGEAIPNFESVENGAKVVETAIQQYGKIDILINNAGILRDASFAKMSEKDWDLIMSVHLRGSFSCTKAAWPHMARQRYGRIINTASASGMYGNFGQANYAAAKMGLVGLTRCLAEEGKRSNILVNCIAPLAGTRMTESILPKEVVEALRPEYVAPLVAFLCSDVCKDTGEIFEVGAGWVAKVRWQRAEGHLFPLPFTADDVSRQWQRVGDFSNPSYPAAMQDSLMKVTQRLEGRGESSDSSSPPPSQQQGGAAPAMGRAEKLFALIDAFLKHDTAASSSLVQKMQSRLQFDILRKKGEPRSLIGQWTIDLKAPPAAVEKGAAAQPDATFTMTEEDFEAVCLGKLNPQIAFMQGRMKIKGSMRAATKFTPQLFPRIDASLLSISVGEAVSRYLGAAAATNPPAGAGGGGREGGARSAASQGGETGSFSAAARSLKSAPLFAMIARHFASPAGAEVASKVQCLYRFDILRKKGEKPCTFTIDMRGNLPRLKEEVPASCDAHFTMLDDDFVSVVTGKLNPQVAFMQGKMKIKGNMRAAMKFTPDLFPGLSSL